MTSSKVLPMEKTLATIAYGQFQDATFMAALARLGSHKFKNPKTTFRVMKLTKAINKELNDSQELFVKTLKEYAKLDDKGEFVPQDNKPGTYVIREEKVDEWKIAFNEFKVIEPSLHRKKLSLDELEDFTTSAVEMNGMSKLIDFGDLED